MIYNKYLGSLYPHSYITEYRYYDGFEVTDQMLNDFKEQGYIIIR